MLPDLKSFPPAGRKARTAYPKATLCPGVWQFTKNNQTKPAQVACKLATPVSWGLPTYDCILSFRNPKVVQPPTTMHQGAAASTDSEQGGQQPENCLMRKYFIVSIDYPISPERLGTVETYNGQIVSTKTRGREIDVCDQISTPSSRYFLTTWVLYLGT